MRRSLSLALSAACAVAGLVLGTGAAQAAPQAAASPATTTSGTVSNCTYGHNGPLWLTATCSASDTTTAWYLSIYCVRGTGKGSWVNGTLVYGSGSSWAECSTGALEIDDSAIVVL